MSLAEARELAAGRVPATCGLQPAEGYPLDETRLTAKLLLLAAAAGMELGPFGRFQIVEREVGRIVGDIGYHSAPRRDGSVEIAYAIAASQRRRGLATEAVGGLVDHAARDPRVSCLRAETVGGDRASSGVLRACGFRSVGTGSDGRDRYELPIR